MTALAALVVGIAIIALAHCSIVAGTAAAPPKGPVTYVFGDSMSEVGNNNYFQLSLAKANYPWYGIDYPKGVATGRFTNGRTIGDYMDAKFGIPSPPPFLSLSMADDDDFLTGVNFASGGAGILNETGVYFVEYFSFDQQISCFESVKKAMIAKIGKDAAEETVNAAMFQIGLGSNDYINNFLQPFMADGTTYTHDQFIRLLVATLDRQLKRLYGLGARKVAFNGLPPLGCIPAQRVKSATGECLEHVNSYAVQFNAAAKKLLDGMNARLPGAQMGLADCYSVVMELIQHPQKHGFTTSDTSCCGVDTKVGGLCLPDSTPCRDRKAYVFWDAYHTSDAANRVIADRLWDDMTSASAGAPAPRASAPGPAAAPAPSPSRA
ncbi:GDSL esterase/lipase At5g37690 [Lolium perenne]|uniref:GDSL esterase/lipase At5g37690 n=1 Tax=Lolium perenne TaxID=4522 RepID=UPI0021EB181D|nr:GDSL esterase/lipase At5g37690 [Lolium perenne]